MEARVRTLVVVVRARVRARQNVRVNHDRVGHAGLPVRGADCTRGTLRAGDAGVGIGHGNRADAFLAGAGRARVGGGAWRRDRDDGLRTAQPFGRADALLAGAVVALCRNLNRLGDDARCAIAGTGSTLTTRGGRGAGEGQGDLNGDRADAVLAGAVGARVRVGALGRDHHLGLDGAEAVGRTRAGAIAGIALGRNLDRLLGDARCAIAGTGSTLTTRGGRGAGELDLADLTKGRGIAAPRKNYHENRQRRNAGPGRGDRAGGTETFLHFFALLGQICSVGHDMALERFG